jgi:hypothetical protein
MPPRMTHGHSDHAFDHAYDLKDILTDILSPMYYPLRGVKLTDCYFPYVLPIILILKPRTRTIILI